MDFYCDSGFGAQYYIGLSLRTSHPTLSLSPPFATVRYAAAYITEHSSCPAKSVIYANSDCPISYRNLHIIHYQSVCRWFRADIRRFRHQRAVIGSTP